MADPSTYRYSDSHEWFSVDGDVVTIGITQYAADELTDITYVEMKDPGEQIDAGEPIVVLWYDVDGKRVVRDVLRFVSDRGGMADLRYYYFCPETLAEVCEALKLPLVDNGYRYPTM